MDNNTQQSSSKLCTVCQQFYGNPANENLCSSCYKQKMLKNSNLQQQNVSQNIKKQQQEEIQQQKDEIKQNENVEQKQEKKQQQKEEEPKEITKPKQVDNNKCWNCNKKVGLLGVKCKCEYTFCNKHRMPEDHKCDFDFASEGKEILKNANPLVQKAKLEKI